VTTKLDRFTLKAREEPQTRFNALMGMVYDPEGLRESFERQDGRKAPGVDGVRKEDYAEGVQARLEDLSARIRRLGYRPLPARRSYIAKGDGCYRPLGVPSFEDRLVQDQLSRILQAIWEPEFCDCSYGFRPGRSAHDALRRVAEVITNGQTQWVVEADIKGFLDRCSYYPLADFGSSKRFGIASGSFILRPLRLPCETWMASSSPRLTRCNTVWRDTPRMRMASTMGT
jgi:hypothetical protein